MSLTVKHLIDKYTNINESVTTFNLNNYTDELLEEELKVLAALNMGVVTEKVLKSRRQARDNQHANVL